MSSTDVDVSPVSPSGLARVGALGEEEAPWLRRVVAVLLDVSLLGGIAWRADGGPGAAPTLWAGLFDPDRGDLVSWPAAVAAVVILVLQAYTGWTPGKLVVGIAVIREHDGGPAGLLRTLGRAVAHLLDAILFIGYLRPLWHREGRTFADSIARTFVVLRRPTMAPVPRRVLTGAALTLCLVGAGLAVSWQTSGGARATAFAQCLPADPVDGDRSVSAYASAEVRGTESWDEERRLWTRDVQATRRNFEVTWTWSPATVPVGDLAIEATVTAPGATFPAFTERWGIEGRSAETSTVALADDDGTGLDRATLVIGDDGTAAKAGITALGRTVDLSTTLLLDGTPVATCTFDGLTLEDLDW